MNPLKMNTGYSIQFISALAFFERVNTGAITSAMQTNENIIREKLNKKKDQCLIYSDSLKNSFVNIKLKAIPLNPKKVFAKTFPKTIVVNFAGLQNIFSRVPIYRSLSISPADEKQMELQRLQRPLPKIT
jgi:hypothetical protein